ncbi:alkaline phosphatase [Alicyclobacillus cellulosilyticus]|uniref:Alkaline phosphatase n=1 Tax=Alicyclobacillus cellulosilyticus TaxID=1003997 RepID=A0A917KDQ1_9BACL|nr:DedA family protein [Alicyclobacillus cellulosilyticus]GGJ09603.1 alkaline phosphatase [Alicyclobacillus cellulosilyticus]
MHSYIAHILQTYGYFGLFVALALEYVFVPVPGETTLTTIGILYQSKAYHLNLTLLILSTTLGAYLGSTLAYTIGRMLGRPFLERYGRYVGLTPARIDRAEHLFRRYTIPTLVVSRYIAGVRILVPYVAGINRVRLAVYLPVMLIANGLWTTTFILAGRVIERAWHHFIHHWRHDLIPAILITAAFVIAYLYFHRWLKRKTEGEPAAAEKDPTERVPPAHEEEAPAAKDQQS